MVSVSDITLEGRELNSRRGAFPRSTRILIFVWVVSSPSMREKKTELEKLFFCKASVFFKLLRKTMFQVPKPTHILIWVDWKQSKHARKNNFSELEKLFFCKTQFHPVRPYKGPRQKNEIQMGLANLTYKQ